MHQLEITVDGERDAACNDPSAAAEAEALDGQVGRGAAAEPRWRLTADAEVVAAAESPARIPHPGKGRSDGSLGVTFIEHNEARDEETLRPRMRGRGTQPALASVTISGPYNATGPGDTPSRRRIFVCRPRVRRRRQTRQCARRRFSRRWRAGPTGGPVTDCRRPAPAAVLHRRPGGRRVRPGHSARARTPAGEPAVPVPHRARSGRRCARHVPIRSAIWSWPRACRSFSGAASPTTSCWTRPPPAS